MNQNTNNDSANINDIKHNILSAIANMSESFLYADNWEHHINDVLITIGEATDVCRVYIAENNYVNNTIEINKRFEWTKQGISPQINNSLTQNISYDKFPKWKESFLQKQPVENNIDETEGDVLKILESLQIKSNILIPIWSNNKWWGFIGFDDCKNQKKWDPIIVEALFTISNIIGSSIAIYTTREELSKEKEYFRSLFTKAPQAIAIININGIIENINEEFISLFNYTREEAIGEELDALISHPEDITQAHELTESVKRGEKVNTEKIRYSKDGVPIFVNITGVPINLKKKNRGIYVIYQDISKRKLTEKNLLESQTKFQELFNTTTDSIFLMKDDIFVECNKSAVKLFECSEEEIVGESLLMFSPEYQPSGVQSKELIQLKIHDTLNIGPQQFEFTHISRKGNPFTAEVTLTRVELQDNIFIQIIIRDISERKKAEKDLLYAKEKAEESDRLKTAFLASMSHEIRTPMNHILGGLDLLLDSDISEEEKQEFHQIIKSSSHSLLKLIEDIIDVSVLDSGQLDIHKQEFDLKTFFNELLQGTEELRQNNPNIDFSINTSAHKAEIDTIYSDKIRLNQIFISLLSNAFKFTEKGNIEVGYTLLANDTLQFYVSDTGTGIPEDSFDIIFEQFRQVDYEHTREFEGAGLGLALAKGLVELLGGEIRVESTLHKGSTFFVTIPIKKPKPIEKPKEIPTENKISYDFSNKTILIVEDEEMNYNYLKTVLKKTNANVLWAENGKKGIEKVENNDINLVLMDIQMPEMNGYETTRRILKIKPNLPVIVQTAHAMKEEKQKCFEAGAIEYMPKPLNRKLLLKNISKYIL